jgi:hypothetical protein
VGEIPASIPKTPLELVAQLIAKSPVPGKLRNNLTGAAQFIENFKHRQTLRKAMLAAFASVAPGNELHRFLAAQRQLPLIVHAWYDRVLVDTMQTRGGWYLVQGASRADYRDIWYRCFAADSTLLADNAAQEAQAGITVVYEPFGGNWPEGNCLVSDADFVEVLTEIDIQSPIPPVVQQIRTGRSFLFLGCRFDNQMDRQFARQIMKRSSTRHWALLPEGLTRNEHRFLEEQDIQPLGMGLEELIACLTF